MSSSSPLQSIPEEGRNRSSSPSSSFSRESDPPAPSSSSSSSSSGSFSSSLSEDSRKIIQNFKSRIKSKQLRLGENFQDPFIVSKFSEDLFIHQNPNNPDDPLNLTLYPCYFTYEEVIQKNIVRKANHDQRLKSQRLNNSDSNSSVSTSKSDNEEDLDDEPEDIGCPRCHCLPQYHPSETPASRCLIKNRQMPKNDSNMMTSEGYCLSCLKFGTLCLMESHTLKSSNNLSSGDLSCFSGTIKFIIEETTDFLKFDYMIDGKSLDLIFDSLKNHNCYIRNCYKELYPCILSEDKEHSSIVTGTPGIGKSTFLFYILNEYMKNQNLKLKPFIVSFRSSSYYVFFYQSDFEYSFLEYKDYDILKRSHPKLDSKFIIYDYPKNECIPKLIIAPTTIILSSPNPNRFSEYAKDNSPDTFYMPVWTYTELKKLDPQEDNWISGYNYFGGVPRYILNILSSRNLSIEEFNSIHQKNMNNLIATKGPAIIENWFNYTSTNMKDDEMSHLLIHKVPLSDDTGKITDYKDYILSFPSRQIYRSLLELNKQKFINNMRTLINSGTVPYRRISNPEDFFEDSFLDFCPPTPGSTITVTQLYPGIDPGRLPAGQSAATINFNFPPSTRSFAPKEPRFESNVFYIPNTRNFQSVDAFFFQENNLYYFQLTTGKKHPVNYNGLIHIKNFFQSDPEIQIKLYLIFVVPEKNPIKYKQTNNQLPQDININQYKWTYKIPSYRDTNNP